MEYLYKYSYTKRVAKYAVISGEIGDINLKLRDVTNHNDESSECHVASEVSVIRHGKVYNFVEPLNEIAEYCLHNLEGTYYTDEKSAIFARVKKQLKDCTDSIIGQMSNVEYLKERLGTLTEKEVQYLTFDDVQLGKTYYIPQIGAVKVIGIISGISGETSYLTDSNYNTHYANCDVESGDRIILVKDDITDNVVTEHGNKVFMSDNDWRIHRENNNINLLKREIQQKESKIQYKNSELINRLEYIIQNQTELTVTQILDIMEGIINVSSSFVD